MSQSGSSDYKNASSVMKKTMTNVINIDLKNEIGKLNCKVLLFWGFNDSTTPLADGIYMNEHIKDSKLVIFYNSGHFPYLDEPDKFTKAIVNGVV